MERFISRISRQGAESPDQKPVQRKKEYMWCACRSDAGLYYKISEDLKIYPEHNGYTHDKYCCRYKDITGTGAQKLPYIVGENGDVTVCTSFDPGRYPGSADNLEQKRRYAVDSNAESTESEES